MEDKDTATVDLFDNTTPAAGGTCGEPEQASVVEEETCACNEFYYKESVQRAERRQQTFEVAMKLLTEAAAEVRTVGGKVRVALALRELGNL